MIKAIIFDFFDVLCSDPYKAWLANHGFKREGRFSEVVNQMDTGKIEKDEFVQTLSQLSGQTIEEIDKEFQSTSQINFEIVDLLKKLQNKYLTGLLSNAPSKYIRKILQDNSLELYFSEIVISSEVGYSKPSKEIFQIILDRLQVPASDAIFIDDNTTHIEAAELLGIKGIVYQSPMQLIQDLARFDIL